MKRKRYLLLICLSLILVMVTSLYYITHNAFQQFPHFNRTKSSLSPHASQRTKAARWEYFYRMLRDPSTGRIPSDIREKELRFANKLFQQQKLLRKSSSLIWTEAGPRDVGGRTRALAVDVKDPNTIIAGGASGGIWKSTDKGDTWELKSLPSQIISITSVAQDTRPGFTNIWYYSNGEFRGSGPDLSYSAYIYGNGVFKSTDNGETWNILENTVTPNPTGWSGYFAYTSKIGVSRHTGSVFVASNGIGLFRTTDGGNNFQLTLGGVNEHLFSDFDIANDGTIVAVISSPSQGGSTPKKHPGLYRSTDDGTSWTEITPQNFPATHMRSVVTIAPSNPSIAYMLTFTGQMKSQDREDVRFYKINVSNGQSEERTNNLPDFGRNLEDFIKTQNNYNMVVAVKPDNENFVLIGATSLFRSTNGFSIKPNNMKNDWIGGYNTTTFFYPNLHPDIHSFAFDPTDPNKMWWGHDGGLSYTTDIRNDSYTGLFPWENKNNGYNVTQFYMIAIPDRAKDYQIMGGTQDNGTPYFKCDGTTISNYTDVSSGDGAYAYFGKNYSYTSSQMGKIIRLHCNSNGELQPWQSGGAWSDITPTQAKNQLFINPFSVDPIDEEVMFYPAGNQLWRNSQLSNIPEAQNGTMSGWSLVNGLTIPQGYVISAVEFSKNNPAHLLYFAASSYSGKPLLYKLENANTSYSTPVNISTTAMPEGTYVHHISINPDNGNEVIFVLSNYNVVSLYHSANAGLSFTAIEGNLEGTTEKPGPSIRAISIMPTNNETIYFAGTSVGLYSTTQLDGGNTVWIQESPDLIGNVIVNDIAVRTCDGRIVVGTHGRGAFLSSIGSSTGTAVASVNTDNIKIEIAPGNTGSATFRLSNTGNASLNYTITSSGSLGQAAGDVRARHRKPVIIKISDITDPLFLFRNSVHSSPDAIEPERRLIIQNSTEGSDVLSLDDGNDTPDTFAGFGNSMGIVAINQFDLLRDFTLEKIQFYFRTEISTLSNYGYVIYDDTLGIIYYGTASLNVAPEGEWFTITLDTAYKFKSGHRFFIQIETYNMTNYPAGYDLNAQIKGKSYYMEFMGNKLINMNTVSGMENGAFLIRAVGTYGTFSQNKPPVLDATITPTNPQVGKTVTFDASNSYDPDGIISKYLWEFGDDASSDQKIATHVYDQKGSKLVRITVWDNFSVSASGTATINIVEAPDNIPPIAIAQLSKTTANVGESITFDASASSDQDGQVVSYNWKFGDGSSSSEKVTQHFYNQQGTYSYSLLVTDNIGVTGSTTGQVVIQSQQSRLTIIPSSGTISANSFQDIQISYNAEGMSEGNYYGQIEISGNGGTIILPVSIIISNPVDVKDNTGIPENYALEQNYPNPFNPSTNIQFSIPEGGFVSLILYDINGREIRTLLNEYKSAGTFNKQFDAGNLNSGVYIYRIKCGKFEKTRKLILLK